MTIEPKLLELLRCPRCKGTLTKTEDDTALDCASCALRYPLVEGIPCLLPSEAQPLSR